MIFQVQWLNDLFQVMTKEYIHVGCNVQEIQTMKEELQAFQETAKVKLLKKFIKAQNEK